MAWEKSINPSLRPPGDSRMNGGFQFDYNRRFVREIHSRRRGRSSGCAADTRRVQAGTIVEMIAFLRGKLLSKTPNRAIVECGGVGYDATISVATFTALPGEGAEARLHIYTHVREDQIALFGFTEPAEKRMFEKLLTITGIGPKLAITVLSGIDAGRLVTAIRASDHATLTRIPGIGKKTAERVVLELKDKMEDMAVAPLAGGVELGAAGDDALSALVNLGYARPVAQRAIEAAIAKTPAAAKDFEALFRAAMAAIR
jgi:holliday junction DNA helicase RuvA